MRSSPPTNPPLIFSKTFFSSFLFPFHYHLLGVDEPPSTSLSPIFNSFGVPRERSDSSFPPCPFPEAPLNGLSFSVTVVVCWPLNFPSRVPPFFLSRISFPIHSPHSRAQSVTRFVEFYSDVFYFLVDSVWR